LRSEPASDHSHRRPGEHIHRVMIATIDRRNADAQHYRRERVTESAREAVSGDEHDDSSRNVRAWKRPAVNAPVLFNQADDGGERPPSQFDTLQMCERVMGTFNREEKEDGIAEIIGRTHRDDISIKAFAPSAQP